MSFQRCSLRCRKGWGSIEKERKSLLMRHRQRRMESQASGLAPKQTPLLWVSGFVLASRLANEIYHESISTLSNSPSHLIPIDVICIQFQNADYYLPRSRIFILNTPERCGKWWLNSHHDRQSRQCSIASSGISRLASASSCGSAQA